MNIRRLLQVIKYGKKDAEIISHLPEVGLSKWAVFKDIVINYLKYNLWSNQYKKEEFWKLDAKRRNEVGQKYKQNNADRERWLHDYFENYRFLNKWKSFKYESSAQQQHRRIEAYRKRYTIGESCFIGHDVIIDRHHYLNGTLQIGNHVLLAKHVHIDYSGEVIIEDGVKLAEGVNIESHHRDLEAYQQGRDVNIPTKLRICEKAYIGTRAIILDSCNYIGKNVRIGAGAVVTKDIPDNSVAVGVPAKVIKVLE